MEHNQMCQISGKICRRGDVEGAKDLQCGQVSFESYQHGRHNIPPCQIGVDRLVISSQTYKNQPKLWPLQMLSDRNSRSILYLVTKGKEVLETINQGVLTRREIKKSKHKKKKGKA